MAGWDSFSVQNGPGDWCPPPYNPPNLQLEIFSTRNYMLLIGDQLFVTVGIILVWICHTGTAKVLGTSRILPTQVNFSNFSNFSNF